MTERNYAAELDALGKEEPGTEPAAQPERNDPGLTLATQGVRSAVDTSHIGSTAAMHVDQLSGMFPDLESSLEKQQTLLDANPELPEMNDTYANLRLGYIKGRDQAALALQQARVQHLAATEAARTQAMQEAQAAPFASFGSGLQSYILGRAADYAGAARLYSESAGFDLGAAYAKEIGQSLEHSISETPPRAPGVGGWLGYQAGHLAGLGLDMGTTVAATGGTGLAGSFLASSQGAVRNALEAEGVTDESTIARTSYALGTTVAAINMAVPIYALKGMTPAAEKALTGTLAQISAKIATGVVKVDLANTVAVGLATWAQIYGVKTAAGKPVDWKDAIDKGLEAMGQGAIDGLFFGAHHEIRMSRSGAYRLKSVEEMRDAAARGKGLLTPKEQAPEPKPEAVRDPETPPVTAEDIAKGVEAAGIDPEKAAIDPEAAIRDATPDVPALVEVARNVAERVQETMRPDEPAPIPAEPMAQVPHPRMAELRQAIENRVPLREIPVELGMSPKEAADLYEAGVAEGVLRKTTEGAYRRNPAAIVRDIPDAGTVRAQIDTAIQTALSRLPEGVTVKAFDAIGELPEAVRQDVERVQAQGRTVDALTEPKTGNIWLARAALNPDARLSHETVHSLVERNLLRPDELRMLAEAADKIPGLWDRKAYEEAYRDYANPENALMQEAAAHLYEARKAGADFGARVNGILDRIRVILDQIGETVRRLTGYQTAEDIMRAIDRGDVARREMAQEVMRGEDITAAAVRPDGSLYAFAGERAKTADHAALAEAQKMEGDGNPREDIWTKTGWFKGVDGKWRFEIDDSLAYLNPTDKSAMTLAEGLHHPEFFKSYPAWSDKHGYELSPKLKYLSAGGKVLDGAFGVYRGYFDGIALDKAQHPADLLSTTLHELQHGMQDTEGFARGGDPTEAADNAAVTRQQLRLFNEAVNDPNNAVIPSPELWAALGKKAQAYAGYDAYNRLAGEVEARTVEKRMDLTPEERRARPPWLDYDVPESQQIVRGVERSPQEQQALASVPGSHFPDGTMFAIRTDEKTGERYIEAFHGSPHDFDKFDMSRIGTGEGAQAYGHGLYFADSEGVAKNYRDALSDRPNRLAETAIRDYGGHANAIQRLEGMLKALPKSDSMRPEIEKTLDAVRGTKSGSGKMYRVRINADPDTFLDWDKPLSQQSEAVRGVIKEDDLATIAAEGGIIGPDFSVEDPLGPILAGHTAAGGAQSARSVYDALKEAGVVGIKYLDGQSRRGGEGSRNYVVFDDSLIQITHKDGKPVAPEERASVTAAMKPDDTLYALGDRPVTPGLDMSPEARKQRAQEMGFDTGRVWYHGTPDARGIWKDGFKTLRERYGSKDNDRVYFFARDRSVASTYADDRRAFDYQNAEPETIPAYINPGKQAVVEWNGRPFRGREKDGSGFAIRDYIDKARVEGYDSVLINNVIDTYDAKGKPTTILAVFDPARVRSVNAAFDPARADSPNLLYAMRPEQEPGREAVDRLVKARDDFVRMASSVASAKAMRQPYDAEAYRTAHLNWIKAQNDLVAAVGPDAAVRAMADHDIAFDGGTGNKRGIAAVHEALRAVTDDLHATPQMPSVSRPSMRQSVVAVAGEAGGRLLDIYGPDLTRRLEVHADELASYGGGDPAGGFINFFRDYIAWPDDARRRAPMTYEAIGDFIDAEAPQLQHGIEALQDFSRLTNSVGANSPPPIPSFFSGGTGGGQPPKFPMTPPTPPSGKPPSRGTRMAATLVNLANKVHLGDVIADLQMKFSPMTHMAATFESQSVAKDFANAMRKARWEWQRIDDDIKSRFDAGQREKMWIAADEQSVAEQTGKPTRGIGLDRLSIEERDAVTRLQDWARQTWELAQQVGIVDKDREGLPSYVPRMIMNATKDYNEGAYPKSIGRIGNNLKTDTANTKERKHLLAEDTEAAAKSKLGDDAELVRDIRTLPLAVAKLQEAIAGKVLINKIREVGKQAGDATVEEGPPIKGWFTIPHPAFREFRHVTDEATGETKIIEVGLRIRSDFEGPLKAVLSRDSGKIYQGLMALKGKATSVIMYSPLIHNMVEFGRAFPALPGKMITLKVYFEGNKAKNDPAIMREAIDAGLVPMGGSHARGYAMDIDTMIADPFIAPGRSWTAQALGSLGRPFGKDRADAIKRAVDNAGDFWHGTLLWDRIADLQVGLYVNMRDHFMGKGLDADTAQKVAAHLANRYAGAIPNEAMSIGARKVANVVMFSRSFTLGNIGAMKDTLVGLPQDVRAQIMDAAGSDQLSKATSMAQRKAIAILAVDLALMYVANSMLQNASDRIRGEKTWSQIGQDYIDRFWRLMHHVREHPFEIVNPLEALSATSDNEPGKQERVLVGYDRQGTAIYARNPVGKIGEEFYGYLTSPFQMVRNKQSTIMRPIWQILSNDKGFGRKVYDPNADTASEHIANVGRIVSMIVSQQLPTSSLQAAKDLMTGEGDPTTNKLRIFGPLAGVTFSKGAPGGPAAGLLFHADEKHRFRVNEAMPEIRKMIQIGNFEDARARMTALGIPAGLQRYYVKTTINPQARLTGRKLQDFLRRATSEERDDFFTKMRTQQENMIRN